MRRAEEERAWLDMLRAQPWRRQRATPPPPPPPSVHPPTPPREHLLPQSAPLRHHEATYDHGLRSARHTPPSLAITTADSARAGECVSSTAMRFLLRSPPHIPPLRREDRQEDVRSSYGATLPSLQRWGAPPPPLYAPDRQSTRPSALTSFANRFSIASESDATVPSSTSSTPTSESAAPLRRALHPADGAPPHEWPLLRSEPRAPSLCVPSSEQIARAESSLRHHYEPSSLNQPSPTKAPPPTKRPRGYVAGRGVAPGGAGQEEASAPDPPSDEKPKRKKKKRTPRVCTTPGCDKLVVDHGVCIRHGGGKRCNVEGCTCRAQNRGLCWKHGGYTICRIDGCDKRAKSRGMCWSHGGGTQCKTDGCEKIAVSRGRCWAHGGGKRCKIPDCQKPASLRMDDYCAEHHAQNRQLLGSETPLRRDLDPLHRFDDLQATRSRR